MHALNSRFQLSSSQHTCLDLYVTLLQISTNLQSRTRHFSHDTPKETSPTSVFSVASLKSWSDILPCWWFGSIRHKRSPAYGQPRLHLSPSQPTCVLELHLWSSLGHQAWNLGQGRRFREFLSQLGSSQLECFAILSVPCFQYFFCFESCARQPRPS